MEWYLVVSCDPAGQMYSLVCPHTPPQLMLPMKVSIKRTFLAMAIMIGLLLPILVTLMLLYPKLGKLRDKQIAAASSLGTELNNDKDSTEFSQLMPETDTKLLINCPKSHVLGDSSSLTNLWYHFGLRSKFFTASQRTNNGVYGICSTFPDYTKIVASNIRHGTHTKQPILSQCSFATKGLHKLQFYKVKYQRSPILMKGKKANHALSSKGRSPRWGE